MPDTAEPTWVPDILGEPYEQLTLDLGHDDEGPVVATLVRAGAPASTDSALEDVDVLYVHGWSDYFFQTELADFWTGLGARFFALDLRKYGAASAPGRRPAMSRRSTNTTPTSPRRWMPWARATRGAGSS